ncbi:hypothetical protein BABINDRAFT_81015 [Babjeviella inositovora NRRL Y-12698]|uniref:CBS domain-containing protein n=1 Tax=Babjeviella inositovora NRRL Y-12698 TaxID=984486 RepID=A0A1E3R174_9ASCO|nr:uncharacterized protein BABINDRAFT_81015 [Babjeviella inositovora NRRL Y-12698]ODQ83112.1 hypothetical protein BABINDRAFT_81015 [Babjeviella inositovora NRRL Y-12698]
MSHNSAPFRHPGNIMGNGATPVPLSGAAAQRKPSIAEFLSSPPPLETPAMFANNDEISHLSLSRNPSISSRSSSSSNYFQEWLEIPLSQLIEKNKLVFIDGDMSFEEAFQTLITYNLTSLPIEAPASNGSKNHCLTFDYTDLNTYLLMVLNKIKFSDSEKCDSQFWSNVEKARNGGQVPVKFVAELNTKIPLLYLNERMANLANVVEILGLGIHRIAIVNDRENITGILSQRRLIRYLWENARKFSGLDVLFPQTLLELLLGSSSVVAVYEDEPLINALLKMHNEKMSSLAVVDRNFNLIGNISAVDVKHVSSSNNSHLLIKSCMNFISYILNQRGLENGQDIFPIFHVQGSSSLGRTIAKLVATKAHRLWIVKPHKNLAAINTHVHSNESSSSSSASSSTVAASTRDVPISPVQSHHHKHSDHGAVQSNPGTPSPSTSDLDHLDALRTGKLVGVVSLTDILNLYVEKAIGKKIDPTSARKQRRRSSNSTVGSAAGGLDEFRRSASGSISTVDHN